MIKVGDQIKFNDLDFDFYQDFSFKYAQDILNINQTWIVEKVNNIHFVLIAYGFGILNSIDRNSYGNGAIYVKIETVNQKAYKPNNWKNNLKSSI